MSAAQAPPAAASPDAAGQKPAPPVTALAGHDVLVGFGRIGALVGAGLKAPGGDRPLLVFEDDAAPRRRRGRRVSAAMRPCTSG